MSRSRVMEHTVISSSSDEYPVWRGHRKEAKSGPPWRPSRHKDLVSEGGVSLPVCNHLVVPERGVVLARCNPTGGQPWTPGWTLPHGRDGLSPRRLAVLCTFRTLALCRHGHCQGMHNTVLDVTPLVPAPVSHQRHDIETYRRSSSGWPDTRETSARTALVFAGVAAPVACTPWRSASTTMGYTQFSYRFYR